MDDSDDEEDELLEQFGQSAAEKKPAIPPTHKSRIDDKGIQIVTSYRNGAKEGEPQQLIKTITKVKITTRKVREAKAVEDRLKWTKFGQALIDERRNESEEGVVIKSTVQSKEDIFIEDPNADTDLQEEDVAKTNFGNLSEFWAKQKRRQLERKYDVEGGEGAEGGADAASGWTQVKAGGASAAGGLGSGKYVPPAARGGLAGLSSAGFKPQARTDDLNTIRVTNISENTTEVDLQELFQPFGRISRVYLAKDKETHVSRGFAFVSFVSKDDAARAMEKLQGYGYDHLILKLEWARPNAPKDPATSGNEYRSGYGKALAQDTKAKVSYASNLTR